jgi:hypothetical protein
MAVLLRARGWGRGVEAVARVAFGGDDREDLCEE